jgi:aconitate hydratase
MEVHVGRSNIFRDHIVTSITHQLIASHLAGGSAISGEMISLRPDQVLLQDTNGPMSFLQFEALGSPSLRVPLVVAYVDHNVQQVDCRNSDDHRYLETVSARYGAIVSKAGNGICHQVHLETFSVPGQVLVGTDSHTVLCGAVGMLAFGAGSMEVAVAMGTGAYWLTMPRIVRVWLTGALRPWVTAKDVMLALLHRFSVNGGRGKIFEFAGPGVQGLTVPQRATIANMGAELGLTTTVFPSDDVTRAYFTLLGREAAWRPLHAGPGAVYDEAIDLDLSTIGVLVALPGSPDRVVRIEEAAGTKIDQVVVGSCTNGSWEDMYAVAQIVRGKQVHPSLSAVLFPGSRRVMEAMAREGLTADLLAAGIQIAGSSCGACPGLSHVPASGSKSLRSFNRNFPGRSGTRNDEVYLCSPAVAAAAALTGVITDPRDLGVPPSVPPPMSFRSSSSGLVLHTLNETPNETTNETPRAEAIKGPHIKPVPIGKAPDDELVVHVLLKLADNISTDHISPVGVESLLLRTNIPAIAEHSFKYLDPTFATRAKAHPNNGIVAGVHYGQGSSRETAASGLMVLGVRIILAKSFARIHQANLVNWGIVPLQLERSECYDALEQGDELQIVGIRGMLAAGRSLAVKNRRTGASIGVTCTLSPRERDIVLAGGVLAQARASVAPPAHPIVTS